MTPVDPGVEARLNLVKANRTTIYIILCQTAPDGYQAGNSVVVVADTSDAVGHDITEAACSSSGFNAQKVTARGQDWKISTAIIVVSLENAKSLFGRGYPNVAKGLVLQPSPGCVRVVSITAGAAMLIHSDVRPTSSIAEA